MKHTTILFACRQNAGRSQIAAAIARSLAPSGISILSAGTTPASEIHSNVAKILESMGLEPINATPQQLTDTTVESSDWVITMGCGETCPVFPGKHYEDWEVADPASASTEETEAIVKDIDERVRNLLARIAS